MLEKNKLIAEVDIEECFEFMRFCFKDHGLKTKRHLEGCFQRIRDHAGISLIASLKAALSADDVDSADFLAGMVSGIALALSTARPNEEISVSQFLKEHWSKGAVTDISEAFRARGDHGTH